MIATIRGKITEKIAEIVVVEAAGVGYGLNVTAEDYGASHSGDEKKFYIYDHIRENSHDLFGFIKLDTKDLFEQLLSVNGVGPKMARQDIKKRCFPGPACSHNPDKISMGSI